MLQDMPRSGLSQLSRGARLSDAAEEAIRIEIVTGRLSAGSKVTISGVARLLGTSNTPVREALIRLSEAGLVRFDGNAVWIAAATDAGLASAFHLRACLEAETAAEAARNRSDEQAAELLIVAQESRGAADENDEQKFRQYDQAFHLGVAGATGNPFLEKYAVNAYYLASTLRNVRKLSQRFQASAAFMHVQIAESITNRDADKAAAIGREHVDAVLSRITTTPETPHVEKKDRSS